MGVINVLAKFLIQPKTQDGSFVVEKGCARILGADEATAAILQTQFPELKLCPSSSTLSDSIILRTSQEGFQMSLEDALATATSYLNVLDQQEYTVVSGFKDNLVDATDGSTPCIFGLCKSEYRKLRIDIEHTYTVQIVIM
ncbi:hypothetical protein Ocin01_13761 [Orchesella cincta]|uniref:Uncharacterized protein n=1 Tax=Orchesella cincta TaxID=48709 RepID=A0A1D2MJE5_ORCCI|nr:hypothetical protein Ocin01_13761 [Orchesella cincta]